MNLHLEKVLEKVEQQFDVQVATERGDDERVYLIFSSNNDMEAFYDECRNYTGLENATEYSIDEEFEIETVFDDEYTTCSDCGHIIRTSRDSYSWQPDFYLGDGFIVCNHCFEEDGYIEDYIADNINNPKSAINGLVTDKNLEELGFEKINGDYESGYHAWQTDNPQEIFEKIEQDWEEIVFLIDSVGQFDVHWSVWGRGRQGEE